MKGELINIFHFFIRKLTGNSAPKVEEKLIDSFLEKVYKIYDPESLGDWWAWSYVSFQFAYWSGKKTRFNGHIPANWIFGNKSLERWINRPDSWLYYTNLFLSKYEIERPVEYYKGSMNSIFEIERKRFHNTWQGYVNCMSFSKYSPKSISCLTCKYRSKCRVQVS